MPRKPRPPPETPPDPKDPVLPAVNPVVPHTTPEHSLPFPIVAIGASAGGLEAINALLGAVDRDTGMAFVIVQHLLPTRESLLPEILARATTMRVQQVEDKMGVEPDCVYVIPPGKDLVLGEGMLQLAPRTEVRGQHRPIDMFMRSLAEEHGHKAIAIVLSGTAYDGSLGIQEVKAAGGITFAQDSTAEQASMPRSAVATGAVDLVLPPDEIGRELSRIARHPYVHPGIEHQANENDGAFQRVLGILRHATGVDFSGYKRNTIHRRIARRLLLHKLNGMQDYVRYLQANEREADALFNDLLINVTSFFRNPEAYEALKTTVFPQLTQGRARHEVVRIWALGCSTGEEAYSLAMTFTEYAEATNQRVPLQIFATDLNGGGIEKARTGIYTKGITQDVSPERLRRFFVEVDGNFRVTKPIRDMCVFARQNILSDPPFSKLDLVACRNMLIYLEPGLQQRVFPTLHYSLRERGYLWLGGSETVGSHRDLFELLDARNKIYQKRPVARATGIPLTVARDLRPATPPRAMPLPAELFSPDAQRDVDRVLLARYGPPAVVVDAQMEIVQFRGDTSPFLSPAPGRASMNLMKMLREGLTLAARSAMEKARREGQPVVEKGLRVRASDGSWRDVTIEAIPLDHTIMLVFEEPAANLQAQARRMLADAAEQTSHAGQDRSEGANADEIMRLNRELAAMRDYLQSVIEQHEAANEELQSANEEVQSANEELQSVNEELETSKEEIQSTNEELITVNDELDNRNTELSAINNDLVNLIASVQIAIVIIGPDLRVRRFTPAAEKLFNLATGDVGRPLADIAFHLLTPDFERVVVDVMETVMPAEREVQDRSGRWYSLRVRPYRTLENRIDGAVILLVDIEVLKRAEDTLRDIDRGRMDFLAALAHELRNPLASVSNMARALHGDSDPAVTEQAREIIERQSEVMVRMVDDLLDISRVTHGKIDLRTDPVDLSAVVRDVVEASAHERQRRRQELKLAPPSAPVYVRGDAVRLGQVVSNLLHNASKFTPEAGHIWVSVERDESKSPTAIVRVRDDGIGIAAPLLSRIFDLFVQARTSGQHGNTGVGLGLTLARRLTEMHGGTIKAVSGGEGMGTEFVVSLPAIDASSPIATRRVKRPLRAHGPSRRILIVDDNEDSAGSMQLLFRMAGHEVEMAHDGASASQAALRFKPHAVLLDIGLPDIDGYEVARQMRRMPELDSMLIVAVTGYGREEDVRRSRDAGIDVHMVKPFDADGLMELIAAGRKPG
ncbi:MAG TPA: chemotaxis protein CheB [Usitatibacter sp.]|nr:chemotaxis protein CheB [Usitatibacter sp.]